MHSIQGAGILEIVSLLLVDEYEGKDYFDLLAVEEIHCGLLKYQDVEEIHCGLLKYQDVEKIHCCLLKNHSAEEIYLGLLENQEVDNDDSDYRGSKVDYC